MSRLDEIESRLQAATPGPWVADRPNGFHTFVLVPASETRPTEFIVGSQGMAGYGQDSANATLIANAPADIAALLRVARAVKACLSASSDKDEVLDQAEDELARAMADLS